LLDGELVAGKERRALSRVPAVSSIGRRSVRGSDRKTNFSFNYSFMTDNAAIGLPTKVTG
jgi:hypothetical protein